MLNGRRCGVLGSPIAHSLSPTLHRAAYAVRGLDWEYDAYDVDESGLADFLAHLDDTWRGLSLTMPLKRAVLPLLDSLSERAQMSEAANTVIREAGGRLFGDNTDIPGAAAAIRERLDIPVATAVVLGGGATAGSVLLALGDLGCERATMVVRAPERAEQARAAGERHAESPAIEVVTFDELADLESYDLLISTIPASAQNADVLAAADRGSAVFEVIYDPWPTPLAKTAHEAGKPLVSGLDLLVHQAAVQYTLMTGDATAPLAEMRAAGLAVLNARSSSPWEVG